MTLAKRITFLFALAALLALYHSVGVFWGRDAKLYFVIGTAGLYGLIALALFIARRRLRSSHPEFAEALDSSSFIPWYLRLLDVVLGVSFAFGPPLIVMLVRGEALSWDGEFTGYHLLAMAGGVGGYMLGRAYVVRQWQRKHGGPRFVGRLD